MRVALWAAWLLLAAGTPGWAGDGQQEIRYLLTSVGESGCTFTRNGTEHSAAEAEAHLTMKLARAGSRIDSAEQFVERLASRSSWTGEPYSITCAGVATPSRDWLLERLDRYRAATVGGSPSTKARSTPTASGR